MIPDFQSIMLPILEIFQDKKEHSLQEIITKISDKFHLSDSEREETLSSGQNIINNRVGWAKTYLNKTNLIENVTRGIFRITEDGLKILNKKPDKINLKFLKTLPAYQEWQSTFHPRKEETEEIEIQQTPQELLEYSYLKLKEELAFEILDKVKSCTPAFFEKLVIDLLIKMGYGGSRKDAGQIIGKSGDGGIDGLIKEDKLGLDIIYVQAKRWDNPVTIHQIRDFAGSLLSKKAKKGIFITTSSYPQSAYEFVQSIEHKIVLIDGKELADLMIEYNVGVGLRNNYEIKKIDIDYFEEI